MDSIPKKFTSWLEDKLETKNLKLEALSNDASNRSYYQFSHHNTKYIATISNPETENNQAFLFYAKLLKKLGVIVPQVLHYDLKSGYFLQSHLGTTSLLSILTKQSAQQYFMRAFNTLLNIQACAKAKLNTTPLYSKDFIILELTRTKEWFFQKYLNLVFSKTEELEFNKLFALLVDNFNQQEQVLVHRDYHSENILVLPKDDLGIIDFQDAMVGPICYDLASFLRDERSIRWSISEIDNWLFTYKKLLLASNLIQEVSDKNLKTRFDLTCLQRQLKVLGIFARLYMRDNKNKYLKFMPLGVQYILDVCNQYQELDFLKNYFLTKVIPNMQSLGHNFEEELCA